MPYQLDPRRYYPDAQEQSILIPYLRKYFKFPERSPERNRIASEVSNMLLKFSPHWTHRAVRLWFNNNRTTYIKIDNNDNMYAQNNTNSSTTKSNSINMSQNMMNNQFNMNKMTTSASSSAAPQKTKIGLPPISYFASTPSSAMQSSLPSIEEFVSSSPFPRSIPTSPKGSSSDNMFNLHSGPISNSNGPDFASLINEANKCSQDIDKFAPIISKINQICDETNFCESWPDYNNVVEFPPRQFSFDLSSLLNTTPQIWNNKKFTEVELPKIDCYAVNSGLDSYIIDHNIFIHKGTEFVLASDQIPPEISCYTTSNNYVWVTTKSNEIYRIDLINNSLNSNENNQFQQLPSTDRQYNDSGVVHSQLSLPFQSSQISLCPCGDKVIIYSHDSQSVTVASPDMTIENRRLNIISPSIITLRAIDNITACSMKNNIAISMNDLNTGNIIRHFIGHSKEANHLYFLNNNLLASSAKDSIVRLWDFNVQNPVMTLKTPRKTCKGITGTPRTLITCLDNATVNVVDMRMPNEAKPLMAFDLENANSNVNPMTINYDAIENSLNLYLIEILPQAKVRYVYRSYTNLLS